MNKFTQSGAFRKSKSTAAGSVTSTICKNDWLRNGATLITSSLIELSIRSISDRSDCEGVSVRTEDTFNINFKHWNCLSLSGLTAAVLCSLIFEWFCLQSDFSVWITVITLWYAPAVPPELGGGHNASLGGTLKKIPALRAVVCAPQLQNRAGAYAVLDYLPHVFSSAATSSPVHVWRYLTMTFSVVNIFSVVLLFLLQGRHMASVSM